MRLDWPIGLLALLLVPLALVGYLWIEKRRARYATLHASWSAQLR